MVWGALILCRSRNIFRKSTTPNTTKHQWPLLYVEDFDSGAGVTKFFCKTSNELIKKMEQNLFYSFH